MIGCPRGTERERGDDASKRYLYRLANRRVPVEPVLFLTWPIKNAVDLYPNINSKGEKGVRTDDGADR